MAEPAHAPASVRNSGPILGVLQDEIADCGRLLEIGSGTGCHAVTFGRAFPRMTWQTSDLRENLADISSTVQAARLANVLEPVALDVRAQASAALSAASFDAVYSSNTAHIMAIEAVRAMVALAGRVLRPGGRFVLYGPFKRRGTFNTPSNSNFDASLRARNFEMGIRDLETIDELADCESMRRIRTYAMPANNLIVVWQKEKENR